MIKLTYNIFCDLCGKEIYSQVYRHRNYQRSEPPRPSSLHTYDMGQCGGPQEMCDDCAAPIIKAYKMVESEIEAKRNGS